jgi:hypothetical protein
MLIGYLAGLVVGVVVGVAATVWGSRGAALVTARRDEVLRALRASNDKLGAALAESFSERWMLSATVLHLQAVLKVTAEDRDRKAKELDLYHGATASGAPLGSA